MMNDMKIMPLSEAVSLINDGDSVALGGNTINRAPMSFICEIIKAGKKDLRIIKTAGAMDIDMLCLGNAAKSIDAGFVSYETLGLARHYRRAVEDGTAASNEHACYSIIQALRAAAYGVPFMPVKGLVDTALIDACDYFDVIKSPFDGEQVTVVKAIAPDAGIIQASVCDERGNAAIDGAHYEDVLISRASKKVIVVAEKILKGKSASIPRKDICIPGFLTSAVAESPGGAWPCAHHGRYDADERALSEFIGLKNYEELMAYIDRVMSRAKLAAWRFSQ